MRTCLHKLFLLLGLIPVFSFAQLLPPLTLEYERTWTDAVKLTWQSPDSDQSYDLYDLLQWVPINYFNTIETHDAVVSDGKYIYASYYKYSPGTFHKYDLDGNHLEEIVVDGLPSIYKLTYDGTYFYGICYSKPGIYKFDMEKKELIAVFPTPMQELLHICYIPDLDNGRGGFEVGNPAQGYYVNMQGEFLRGGPVYESCASTAYYNGYIYAYCQIAGSTKGVVEYDLTTTLPTGKVFDLGDLVEVIPYIIGGFALNIDFVEYPAGVMNAHLLTVASNTEWSGTRCYVFKVGERAALTGLQGYNVYKNSIIQNSQLISKSNFSYDIAGLEEETDHIFTVKAVYSGNQESQASESLTVRLEDTRSLPFMEDFSLNDLSINYWSLSNSSSPAWTIIANHDELGEYLPSLRYNYRYAADYNQSLISRTLKTGLGKTYLKFDLTCEPKTLRNELFNVEVYVDGEWKLVASESCLYIPYWTKREYDITSFVAGKEFQLRFRISGNGSSTTYNWHVDNIRVWSPEFITYSGLIESVEGGISNAVIELRKEDDPTLIYTADTGTNGAFNFSDIEKGSYSLIVYREEQVIYSEENYQIQQENTQVKISVPVAYITVDPSPIEVILSENKITTVDRKFSNEGSADWDWQATLQYNSLGTGWEVGKNNIATTPLWKVEQAKLLKSSAERGLVLHQGFLYSVAKTNIIGSSFVLNKYTKEGDFIEEYTISTPEYQAASLVSDGEILYQVTPSYGNRFLYPIDFDKLSITEEKAISVEMTNESERLLYATYNPVNDGFYVGDDHVFYLINREGKVEKRYDITGAYCRQLVLDTFSKDGPYAWLFSHTWGDGDWSLRILQYSLAEEKITNTVKVPSEFSEFTDSNYNTVCGLFGSTALIPGYFTLAGAMTYDKGDSSVYFAYSLFPYENWVSLDENEGKIAPGANRDISLEFSSAGLEDGEEREATLIFSSFSTNKMIELDLKLVVDNSIEEGCLIPEQLSGRVTDTYQVELSWNIPQGHNPLKGYYVYRDQERLNSELITDKSFIDLYPGMGLQSYTITALYETGVESYHSEICEIFVSDPSIVNGVADLEADVINQSHVKLSWKAPKYGTGIFDDFESYDAFIMENIGEWTLYDRDKSWTYGFESIGYPNRSSQMAYMVFDPMKCSPTLDLLTCDGKSQFLACFAANVEKLANDDWLVSPVLNFDRDFTLSFMAKTYAEKYGNERINIGYSLTDNDPDSFIFINGNTPVEVGTVWWEYEYSIPKEAKYVAINCVTMNGFIFLLDNVYIGHKEYYSELKGYNVYRNGEQLNTSLILANNFTDYSLENGEYTYEIEAVYENGTSSVQKTEQLVINKTHEATPPRNLKAALTSSGEASLTWIAPLWSEQHQLRYDDGVPYNSTGYVEEEQLIAIKWEAGELNLYEGYAITGVEFHIDDVVSYVTPFLFINGKQSVELEDLEVEPGKYVTYEFKQPVMIQPDTEYILGYAVKTPTINSYPRSHDKGPGTPFKSDLISVDGINWHSAYELSGYNSSFNFNWNIAALVELRGNVQTSSASAVKSSRWNTPKTNEIPQLKSRRVPESPVKTLAETEPSVDNLLGYNVYRNDVKLNSNPLTVLSYKDSGFGEEVIKYHVSAVYAISGEVNSEVLHFDPTGIDEYRDTIIFYPNPAKERLYIEGEYETVTLLSFDGKIMYTHIYAGEELTEINLNSYVPGVYLLAITKNSNTSYEKLIMQ